MISKENYYMTDLSGKVVLVTGGGKGIGAGISEALLAQGAKVIVAQRTPVMGPLAEKVDYIKMDLLDTKDIDNLVDEIVRRYKGVDILVNNAGMNKVMTLNTFDINEWYKMINTNLTAPVYLTSKISKIMKEKKWGRIINISSISVFDNTPFNMTYAATKAGISHFTRSWAKELARYGVTVNSITPGFVETDLTREIVAKAEENNITPIEQYESIFRTYIPSRQSIKPEEIGQAVLYLCSQASANIIGQNINICGGEFMA